MVEEAYNTGSVSKNIIYFNNNFHLKFTNVFLIFLGSILDYDLPLWYANFSEELPVPKDCSFHNRYSKYFYVCVILRFLCESLC